MNLKRKGKSKKQNTEFDHVEVDLFINNLKKLVKTILAHKLLFLLIFISLVVFFSWLSYGQAFDYYFWRDQTLVTWKAKYATNEIFNFSPKMVSRGRLGALIFDWLAYSVIGYDTHRWQIFGFLLRLFNVFLLYFFTKEFTRSKKAALLAALFSSVFIGGLEAYSWVYGIGAMISFTLLGGAFYFSSYYRRKKKYFLLANILISLAIFIDQWRALAVIVLVAFWEVLMMLSKDKDRKWRESIYRLVVFFAIQGTTLKLIHTIVSTKATSNAYSSAGKLLKSGLSGEGVDNFLYSIGNLIRIPFFPIREEGALTSGDNIGLVLGALALIMLSVACFGYLRTRKSSSVQWILLLSWIPMFYFSSWLYDKNLVLAHTHRYLAFSAIVMPIIWAKFTLSLKKLSAVLVLIVLLITLNLQHADRVVSHDYLIRGNDVVMPVWEAINLGVPLGETGSLFHITGSDYRMGYIFHWGGVWPYGLIRNIKSERLLPVFINEEIAFEKICGSQSTNAMDQYGIKKVYSWNMPGNGVMENNTNSYRVELAKNLPCIWNQQNDDFGPIVLSRLAFIDLYAKDTQPKALLLEWQGKAVSGAYQYLVTLYDKGNLNRLGVDAGEIRFSDDSVITVSYFEVDKYVEYQGFFARILVCREDCTVSGNILQSRLIDL